MSTNSINNLASSYIQSVVTPVVASPKASVSGSPVQSQADSSQVSPFSQMMNTLQQMQQSNPAEYKQMTAQIATSLQAAAKTATADGKTSTASQLTQLATDFTTASKTGQPLNMQSVAKAVGGHGHHGGHHAHASSSSDSSASSSTSTTTSTSPLSQFLASLQSNSSQNEALNPMSIIANAMSSK